MTAADLQTLAADTEAVALHTVAVTEQARLRGLTSAPELEAARLYKQVIRMRIARDRAADDLATATTNYEAAWAEYRAVKMATV